MSTDKETNAKRSPREENEDRLCEEEASSIAGCAMAEVAAGRLRDGLLRGFLDLAGLDAMENLSTWVSKPTH